MNGRRRFRKIISLLLSITMIFSLTVYTFASEKSQNSESIQQNATNLTSENINISDSLVPLEIREIENIPISIENVNIDEIVINCIKVTDIETLEIQNTSINDEFVYLAYKNFVSV